MFDEEDAKKIAEDIQYEYSEDFLKGLNEEASEHFETVGEDPLIIGGIVRDHLKKDPHYYTQEQEQKQNSKDWGEPFDSAFLEPGIASYEDVNQGISLLKKDTIDKFVKTFIGRPVIINHDDKLVPGNMEDKAQGYIHEVYFCAEDGWYHARGLMHGDDGKKKIKDDNWSVSCAYDVVREDSKGGEWHAAHYDNEILEFSGNHLALVENPRYEGASIKLNSKKGVKQMKFFMKSNKKNEDKEPEQRINDDNDRLVKIHDEEVPISKLLKEFIKEEESEPENKKNDYLGDDDEVEHNGKKYKVSDLKKHYMKKNESDADKSKKSEESEESEESDEDKKSNDDDESKKSDKKNDDDEDRSKSSEEDKDQTKKETIKENSKKTDKSHFDKLNQLSNHSGSNAISAYMSKESQYKAGSEKY